MKADDTEKSIKNGKSEHELPPRDVGSNSSLPKAASKLKVKKLGRDTPSHPKLEKIVRMAEKEK